MGACTSAADRAEAAHLHSMAEMWDAMLANRDWVKKTARSKRSPFKFQRRDEKGVVDVNLGITTVAFPDDGTEFGRRFLKVIDDVQSLCKQHLGGACKRQTVPHMSIGSVMLDKDTPEDFNDFVLEDSGRAMRARALLESTSPAIRAKIDRLQINSDGCVTFQLQHDPAQNTTMAEADLDAALRRLCARTDVPFAREKRHFKPLGAGLCEVTRFQKVRLELSDLGCEVKGMWNAGHMVVVNLVDTERLDAVSRETRNLLWSSCRRAWAPLVGQWFELSRTKCLCYVERSLNEGSVVAPAFAGERPAAYPEGNAAAASLMDGLFTSSEGGDVLIDIEKFGAALDDPGTAMWRAFYGEVRETAEDKIGGARFQRSQDELQACFKVFDIDGSGRILVRELGEVMDYLGERLSDEELRQMMEAVDTSRDGTVSYHEFLGMMTGGHGPAAGTRGAVTVSV